MTHMRVALFCHSIRSDWHHAHAHFLRGVASELHACGHDVKVFEPRDAWSAAHLAAAEGTDALDAYRPCYPALTSELYDRASFDADAALDGVDLVLVHHWTDAAIVAAIGRWRALHGRARVLFHDTHHRAITSPDEIGALDLRHYDGVLAFGDCLRETYLRHGWIGRAWTWHEAADVRLFRPRMVAKTCDVVWIGNWGDEERAAELDRYLLRPVAAVGVRTDIYGVAYPDDGRRRLERAGASYRGWLPNYRMPEVFARARVTVDVPRRAYTQALRGVPSIRVFEALACGIPLVSAAWDDAEGLFTEDRDYLMARTGAEMASHLRDLLHDAGRAQALAAHGVATIRARHTCVHRVGELMAIASDLGMPDAVSMPRSGGMVHARSRHPLSVRSAGLRE
jgi:spore maturation protein CgeB